MDLQDVKIKGVIIKDLHFYSDDRGWLTELFRKDEVEENIFPEMGYISMTKPGIIRGPHEHLEQTDCFIFNSSSFKLHLWDNRKESHTFKETMSIVTGAENPKTIIIPPGVVHAYKNIGSADGIVLNFPNKLFAGWRKKQQVDEIRHEDDPDTVFKVD